MQQNLEPSPNNTFQNTSAQDFYDANHNKHQVLGSTRNTFNIKTISQFYKHNHHHKIPEYKNIHIWNQSASTMTRDKSPQHKFPQQKRFRSLEQDRARSQGKTNKLNLRCELKLGQTFACSKRKTYFPPQHSEQKPAPWSYGIRRWLQYENEQSDPQKKANVSVQIQSKNSKCYNPDLRGRTMTRQKRDNAKYYLDHSRVHVNHHQQISIDHPGVGKYSIQVPIGRNKPSYYIGQILNSFKDNFPAQNAYENNIRISKPSTVRETIERSKRLDLSKPLNQNPGPGEYQIDRYLQCKR